MLQPLFLLFQKDEKQIDEILKDCYFEWAVIDKEEESLVECIEAICIVHGTYPLNIGGYPAINSKWREHMMNERGKVKDKIILTLKN